MEGNLGTAQCGLHRLMLKLPAARKQLEALAASSSRRLFCDLFEAYDEACIALEAFRHQNDDDRPVREYEVICAELEAEVIRQLETAILWLRS
ncbi:nodulation protein [Rhizobium chutanense]|uniref:Nodulation protein n=1 Tax=Rhizobium chutanense TaxID=2035448 RepID=A0A2A6J9H3_9HYPH|nr:nodulation protein [Rhizobium chutanense]